MPHPHRHCSLASSPQSDPNDELEAQTSKLRKADILLSSLPLGEEKQHSVVLEVKFSLALGVPACPVITQRGLGPTLASYLSTKGQRWGSDLTSPAVSFRARRWL